MLRNLSVILLALVFVTGCGGSGGGGKKSSSSVAVTSSSKAASTSMAMSSTVSSVASTAASSMVSSVASSAQSSTSSSSVIALQAASWSANNSATIETVTDGIKVTSTVEYDGAKYTYEPEESLKNATVKVVVRIDSTFKASGAGLQLYAFVNLSPDYPEQGGCPIVPTAELMVGSDVTISCVLSDEAFNQTAVDIGFGIQGVLPTSGSEIPDVGAAPNAPLTGSFIIKSASIELGDPNASSSSSSEESSSSEMSSSSEASSAGVSSSSEASSSEVSISSESSSSEVSSSSEASSSEISSSSEASSAASSSSSSTGPVPIAVYSFEDNLNEASGILASGTITGNLALNTGGTVSYAAGPVGRALVLDGSSGVKLANNLITDHSYTVSIWLNPNTVALFSTGFFGWVNGDQWISVVPRGPEAGGPGGPSYTMLWTGSHVGKGWFDGSFDTQIPTGSWSHLVTTVNNGVLKTYLNGVLRTTLNGFPDVFTGENSEFSLGVNHWNTPFNGKIDEVKVYNEVLTIDDVTALYGEGPDVFNLPVGDWWGKDPVVADKTGGVTTIPFTADWQKAGIWVAAADAAIEGHTIEIDVKVSTAFKNSGGALYIYSFIDSSPSYPSESDCAWLTNAAITAGSTQTISCTISTGGVFNQTAAGLEIQLVARTDSGTPNGSVVITGSRVIAPQ